MKPRTYAFLLVISLLLAACAPAPARLPDTPTYSSPSPQNTATSTLPPTPTETLEQAPAEIFTEEPAIEPDLQATVSASGEPQMLQAADSPDGSRRAEVRRWDCIPAGEGEMAFEELKLTAVESGLSGSTIRRPENWYG